MLRFRPPRLRMSLSSVPTTERHRRQQGLVGCGDKGVVHLHRVFRLHGHGFIRCNWHVFVAIFLAMLQQPIQMPFKRNHAAHSSYRKVSKNRIESQNLIGLYDQSVFFQLIENRYKNYTYSKFHFYLS